jgi:hypothetical protein
MRVAFRLLRFTDYVGKTVIASEKVKVKLLLFLTKHHAMKTYWGWRYSTKHS